MQKAKSYLPSCEEEEEEEEEAVRLSHGHLGVSAQDEEVHARRWGEGGTEGGKKQGVGSWPRRGEYNAYLECFEFK